MVFMLKYPLSMPYLMNSDFFGRFSKNTQISNLMKIRPVRAVLFHVKGRTDGQIDMPKLRVAFRNFANALKTALFTKRKATKNQSVEAPREYQMLERCELVQTRSCKKFIYPVAADTCSIR
jgi:hypothetical protein